MDAFNEYANVFGAAWGGWLGTIVGALVIVAATAVVAKIAVKFFRHVLQRDETPLPSSSIFLNIVRVVVWAIGASIMLGSCFGIDVSAAVTALGVGGIAISLGFQDTISNFFGGLQLSLMRIIEPGDNIRVGSDTGVVKDVTWRHTTIVNSAGEVVVIPNSVINKASLAKLAPPEQLVVKFVNCSKDRSPEELHDLVLSTSEKAAREVCALTEPTKVLFTEVTESGLRGKVVMRVEDASKTAVVADAVSRAIAPLLVP